MSTISGPGEGQSTLSRRAFLKLCGLHAAGLFLPIKAAEFFGRGQEARSELQTVGLPEFASEVLRRLPDLRIDTGGLLKIRLSDAMEEINAPLARTRWNLENDQPVDRLDDGVRWGIVLHWFGDDGPEDMPLDAYLRGFDALRPVFNYETRTSAHFLVGGGDPAGAESAAESIGIIQTQVPDSDGHPFLGSHLQALDYSAHLDRKQYFVRAYYQLARDQETEISVLQTFFDSPVVVDPNRRTLAVEITGHSFDEPDRLPSVQKIANVTALVWALMRRYRIRATDILGHHEIQLGKSDPGKKFTTLIRLLVGLLALYSHNPADRGLVFDSFLPGPADHPAVPGQYFEFVRAYLALVGKPYEVYEWEAVCQYWTLMKHLQGPSSDIAAAAQQFNVPLQESSLNRQSVFMDPMNHEGVDLVSPGRAQTVRAIAGGTCIYAGAVGHPHSGNTAVFRHVQPDGAEVLSVYGHLEQLGSLQTGIYYPEHTPIGEIRSSVHYKEPYLHFALAYGAAWEHGLSQSPAPPLNAGASWIRDRYLDPMAFLDHWSRGTTQQKRYFHE